MDRLGCSGSVKKVGTLKLVHFKYDHNKGSGETEAFLASFQNALKFNDELQTHISRAQEDLDPLRV